MSDVGPSDDEEREEINPQEAPSETEERLLTIPELVRLRILEFAQFAWIRMGLLANPATQKVDKDLPQARLAIDCAAALAEQLQPHLDDHEKRELQTLLANLRINYVEQSK